MERLNLAGNIFVNLADAYNHFPRMGSNLKYLILKRCYITYVQDQFFQNLDVLQYLNLAENQLRRVPAAVRRPSLLHLDLSYQCWPLLLCPFDLNSESFEGMISLRRLDIKGVLRRVDAGAFSGAEYLEELDISSIFLTRIDKNAFVKNSRLRWLRCHQCWVLEPIHHEMWGLVHNIEHLDLSYSPHSIVDQSQRQQGGGQDRSYTSIQLPYLKTLNLTCSMVVNNSICDEGLYQFESPLDPELLKALVRLETLDLSKNGLTSWTERRFHNNSELRHLSLRTNKFKTLTEAMLQDFQQLEYLDLR